MTTCFDFVIPKSHTKPERIIRAINRPSKDTAQAVWFAWIYTKDVRPSESIIYALLNDTERQVPTDVVEALKNYKINPVLWSHRDVATPEFAA
jgi:hypothetical protein